jgi:hypothetical protein
LETVVAILAAVDHEVNGHMVAHSVVADLGTSIDHAAHDCMAGHDHRLV